MGPKKHQSQAERFAKITKGSTNVDIGFISFSDVVQNYNNNDNNNSSNSNNNNNTTNAIQTPIYTGSDPELSVISKKLKKNNSSTRLKALGELKLIIQDKSKISEFLPFFTFIYEKVLLDNDQYVREEVNSVLDILLKSDRKLFKPYIQSIIGPLWMSTSDSVESVSQIANITFESIFPNPEKRIENISNQCPIIFSYIHSILQSKPDTLSDMTSTSQEEANQRYERVVCSTFFSLAKLITIIPQDTLMQHLPNLINEVFWRKIFNKRSSIRQSIYQILSNLSIHIPTFFTNNNHNNNDHMISILIQILTKERDSLNIPSMFHAFICFMKAFPHSWDKIHISNILIPQIEDILLNHSNLCLPALLPLIASIPLSTLILHEYSIRHLIDIILNLNSTSKLQFNLTSTTICAEITTFLIIQFLKQTNNQGNKEQKESEQEQKQKQDDQQIPEIFISHLIESLTIAVTLLIDHQEISTLSRLLIHLHKQSLSSSQNFTQVFRWDQQISKALQSKLLEIIKNYNNYKFNYLITFINSIITLFSNILTIDTSSSKNTQDIGYYHIIISLYRLIESHVHVLSKIIYVTDAKMSHILLILFILSGLKLSTLILPTIQNNPDLISLNEKDLISFITSSNWYYSIAFIFHHHNLQDDEQFKYILESSKEIHLLIIQIISTFDNLYSLLFPSLIQMIKLSKSILPVVLCLKDEIFSICLQNYNIQSIKDDIFFLLIQQQQQQLKNESDEYYSFEYDISIQVALLVYQQNLNLTFQINDENNKIPDNLLSWKILTDYFHSINKISNNYNDYNSENNQFSTNEKNQISNYFCYAFFLNNDSNNNNNNSRVISNYFNIISSWEHIENKLRYIIPSTHLNQFTSLIINNLKSILFNKVHINNCNENIMNNLDKNFDSITSITFTNNILKLYLLIKSNYFNNDQIDDKILLELIGMSSLQFWEDLLLNLDNIIVNNFNNFLFIIEVLIYLDSLWNNVDEDQKDFVSKLFPLLSNPKLCFQVIYTLISSKDIILLTNSKLNIEQNDTIILKVDKSINICLDMISNLIHSKLDYLQYFIDILVYSKKFIYLNDQYQKNYVVQSFKTLIQFNSSKLQNNSCLSVLNNNYSNDNNIDYVQISNISKGLDVFYIDHSTLENGYKWISSKKCKILDIDKQVGEIPFYTLGFSNGREIQTERNRFLTPPVAQPSFITNSDLVFDINILRTNLQEHFSNQFLNDTNDVSTQLLMKLAFEISQLMFKFLNTTPSNIMTLDSGFYEKLDLFYFILQNLFPIIDELNDNNNNDNDNSSWLEFIGLIRSTIIHLLSLHPIGCIKLVQTGLELLKSLCSIKAGRGNGIWIHFLIIPYLSNIFQMIKTSKLVLNSEERNIYLLKLLESLTSILHYFPSTVVSNLSISVLDYTISEFDNNGNNNGNNFYLIITNCSSKIWNFKMIDNKVNSNKFLSENILSNWEKKCLINCFDILLNSNNTNINTNTNTNTTSLSTTLTIVNNTNISNELINSSITAINLAFDYYHYEVKDFLINSEYFNTSTELIAWNLISNSYINLKIRLTLSRIFDIWFRRDSLSLFIPTSNNNNNNNNNELDDSIAGHLLLQQLFGESLLKSFEINLLKVEQLLSISTECNDILLWCSCQHNEHDVINQKIGDNIEKNNNEIYQISHQSNNLSNQEHIDFIGILLQWLLILQKFDTYCSTSKGWVERALIGAYLGKSKSIQFLLKELLDFQQLSQARCFNKVIEQNFQTFNYYYSLVNLNDYSPLVSYSLRRTVCCLPAFVRSFYLESCSRLESSTLEKFIENYVFESLIKREASIITSYQTSGLSTTDSASTSQLSITCSILTGEITSTFIADEVSIEMTIRLPKLYPLRNVEVECKRKMGINENRWRRWTLQIIQLLSQRDGSVLDAILLWKKNIDREFEGIEPCPICYSVLDPKNLSLPSLQCPTCRNKFHQACLYKWFSTSGKSKCVLCQQPFFN